MNQDQHADLERATCPECGSDRGCPANDITPRWEHDAVRIRLGFDVEGRRCPNCGADQFDGSPCEDCGGTDGRHHADY